MTRLRDLVAQELGTAVDPRVAGFAEAIAKRHAPAARAVLFYGSCLRERQLDQSLLDFYLIVSDYRAAYERNWLRAANALIPPNVFYVEHDGLRAKYAVLSERDFSRLNGPGPASVSVWARFAQPSRLVWAADPQAAERAIDAVARAAPTLLAAALEKRGEDDPLDLWKKAFRLTYSAELRAERKERGQSIVDLDPERYRRFALAALPEARSIVRSDRWSRRRLVGKFLSVVRLAKASATFAGGADYIAWKINRHSGTAIELRGWQRRWPLLAALSLLPRLLRSGAIR